MDAQEEKDTALTLLGGGFNGAITVGSLRYIWKKRPDVWRRIRCMEVISVNSLSGLYTLCIDDIEELVDTWRIIQRIGPKSIFQPLDVPSRIFSSALYSTSGIEKLIDRKLDFERIFHSDILAEVVTYNESRKSLSFFSNRFSSTDHKKDFNHLRKAVLGSVALPGIFPRQNIDGEKHSDALTLDPDRSIVHGCKRTIIINNDHDNDFLIEDEWWLTRLGKMLSQLLYGRIKERMGRFYSEHPEHEIIIAKPSKSLPFISTFGFEKRTGIDKAINYGEEMIARALE